MYDRDDDGEQRRPRRLDVPLRGVRHLLLDAVLLIEEADLRLEELGVVTLRERLLRAADKLTLAANALTNPGLLPEEKR